MMLFVIYHYKKIVALILGLYLICNLYCISQLNVTGDEVNYYVYGVNILKQQPQKEVVNGLPKYNSHMPIVAINALPRAIHQLINIQLKRDEAGALSDIKWSRLFSLISALLLALYVLKWTEQLYGKIAAVFSLLLYCLCPNILAHSQMVGTDVYSFLLCTGTFYHLWRYTKTNSILQLLLVAVMLGLGQITKQSLLLLYPVVFIFLAMRLYRPAIKKTQYFFSLLKQSLLIVLVSLLIINAGFLFYKTGKRLNEYHFVSQQFQQLQQRLSFAGNIPIPLPEPYIAGFDYVRFNTETVPGITGKSSYGAGYFLGERITGKWIWYYYPVSCLYKLPIPFLLFLFSALLFYWIERGRFQFREDEIFLLLPAAFIFISFCFFNTMYLGIRSIVMLLPLLFIFCGMLVTTFTRLNKKMTAVLVGLLLLWQAVSVFSYFPHFLPYTNEFIPYKINAHKVFGDNNLYLQEGWDMAQQYLHKHPAVQFEPAQPVHGRVMVSLETYYDYWNEGKLNWLKALHLHPVDHFHSQYLIFEVP